MLWNCHSKNSNFCARTTSQENMFVWKNQPDSLDIFLPLGGKGTSINRNITIAQSAINNYILMFKFSLLRISKLRNKIFIEYLLWFWRAGSNLMISIFSSCFVYIRYVVISRSFYEGLQIRSTNDFCISLVILDKEALETTLSLSYQVLACFLSKSILENSSKYWKYN